MSVVLSHFILQFTLTFPNGNTAHTTTKFASGVIDTSFVVAAAWQQFAFTFVAPGTMTRIGLYSSYKTGDTVHSINVDDLSVQGEDFLLYWDTAADNSGGGYVGSISKTGGGTLVLSGGSTYSGVTAIEAGVIKLGAPGIFEPLVHYDFKAAGAGNVITNLGTGGAALNGTMSTSSSIVGDVIRGNVLKVSTSGGYGGVTTLGNVAVGNQFTLAACVGDASYAGTTWQRIVINNFQNSGYLGTDNSNPNKYTTIVKNNNHVTTKTIEAGWHFVDQVWDGTYDSFYYDGRLVDRVARSGVDTTYTGKFGFGNNPISSMEYWRGLMSDSFVFTNALTDAEMLQLSCLYGGDSSSALPVTTEVKLTAGAILDLNGNAQKVRALSGEGIVTGGTLRVTGVLTPGGTNRVTNALAVQGGLTLAAGITNRFDYSAASADVINVSDTLTIKGSGTVELSAIEGARPPQCVTLFTFGELAGEANLSGWTVRGAGLEGRVARVRRTPNTLEVVIHPSGTVIIIL